MANSISKIKIPSGTVYEVKDDTSRGGITDLRSKIDNLNSVVGASIERREGSATSTYGGTVTILSGIRLKANGMYKMTATLNRSISDQPVAVELKKSDGTVYQSVTIPVGETTTEYAMFGNIGNADLENCYVAFRNPSGLVNSLTCTVVIDTAVAKPVDNISKKLDKPSTEGTAGQVVASDGNGGTEWVNMVQVTADVTDLPEGSSATVTSALVGGAPKLTFGIPAGATGRQGDKGDRGDTVVIAKDYADLTFPVYAGKTYCYYDNKPYVANTDIATTEAWTAAHWDEVSFEDEIGDLKSAFDYRLSSDTSEVANVFIDNKNIGTSITYKSSTASKTYKHIAPVKAGMHYKVVIHESDSPAGEALRDSVIVDSQGIVKQQFSYTNVAGQDGIIDIIPNANGYLCMCVDKNIEGIDIYGGTEVYNAHKNIEELRSALDDFVKFPEENIISVSDINTPNVAGRVSYETDTETGEITITNNTTDKWNCLQTQNTFIGSHLVVGKKYRLHAKAEVISGFADLALVVRGIQGNADGEAKSLYLSGIGEGYIDFVADSFMQRISLFVSHGRSTINSVVKYSDIWLKEFDASNDEMKKTAEMVQAIGDMTPYGNIISHVVWERGAIYPDVGSNLSNVNRIRTADYVDLSGVHFFKVDINEGYSYCLYWYDSNHAYHRISRGGQWYSVSDEFEVPADIKYARISVTIFPEQGTAVDVETYANAISVKKVEKIVSVVRTINDKISEFFDSVYPEITWEHGGLGNDLTTRIRSNYFRVGKGTTLNTDSESTFSFIRCDDNFKTIEYVDWRRAIITIDDDCIIRIALRLGNNNEIADSEIESLASRLTVNYKIPTDQIWMANGETDVVTVHKAKKDEIFAHKTLKSEASGYTDCDLKIMFFTDVHAEANRCRRIRRLVDEWGSSYFDIAVCGGDIMKSYADESVEWYNNAFDGMSVPLLTVIGNHEILARAGQDPYTSTYVYNKYIASVAEHAEITQPEGAEANGYNYYYKDINGIRLIVVDSLFWDSTQLSWLESTLTDARTNNIPVIAFSHLPFPVANMEKIECSWSISTSNGTFQTLNLQAAQAVKDFIDAGGSFISWVFGHLHTDQLWKLPDYGNQLAIGTSCVYRVGTAEIKNTSEAAYNYDCVTYIAVNLTRQIIKAIRIGADVSVLGGKHNGISLDYVNRRLITAW